MAALAADRYGFQIIDRGETVGVFQVKGTKKIYKGSIVCVDATGFALPAADTAGLKVIGIATYQADNTSGADGAISVEVIGGVEVELDASSIAQLSVGSKVFAVDDHTVDETTTNSIPVGILTSVSSATKGFVYIPYLQSASL